MISREELERGHFQNVADALRDAERSGMPMLEVVAARDLKAVVVAAEAKADMVIDAACAKMNKTRADLERHMRI